MGRFGLGAEAGSVRRNDLRQRRLQALLHEGPDAVLELRALRRVRGRPPRLVHFAMRSPDGRQEGSLAVRGPLLRKDGEALSVVKPDQIQRVEVVARTDAGR